ncbi:MAG: PAS domain S-box protein, partial [Asgard group archaeon]|nr:PAS domain S-box protein [Asgard group archaeon]
MPESSNIESSRGKKFEVPPKLDKILNDAEWYKKVIETMADGVIATDMNQTIVYVNTKLLKMLRYSSEELLGTNSYAIVVEEDRNKVIRETERRYQEKSSTQYEVSMKSKYGTKIPVLITGTPILAEGGETIGTYALVTDISDRKLVEKELRNKNIELQTLYNNLLQLYEQLGSILAETTNIHTEIYLFTSKECVYCAPAEEVLQEVLAAYGGKITYRKVDIDEEPELAEKYEVMSLPTIAIGEEKLTAVPDMYKLHSALFSALVPEEKFRRTRQELDNIITYSPIAIFTINNEGILTSANPLVEMMMGKKRSDLIGKNIIFSNGKGEKIKNHDL